MAQEPRAEQMAQPSVPGAAVEEAPSGLEAQVRPWARPAEVLARLWELPAVAQRVAVSAVPEARPSVPRAEAVRPDVQVARAVPSVQRQAEQRAAVERLSVVPAGLPWVAPSVRPFDLQGLAQLLARR